MKAKMMFVLAVVFTSALLYFKNAEATLGQLYDAASVVQQSEIPVSATVPEPAATDAGIDPSDDDLGQEEREEEQRLLKFYNPQSIAPDSVGIGDWAQCLDPRHNNFPIVADKTGQLKEECRPDTLYSWGSSRGKLQTFIECASGKCNASSNIWSAAFPDTIYTHINPLITCEYGDTLLRIKLKPELQFLFSDALNAPVTCEMLTTEQKKNTVIFQYDGDRKWAKVEYLLCEPGPIHSWSIGTKQAYDELVSARFWIKKHRDEEILPFRTIDGKGLFPRVVNDNLAEMREQIEKGNTWIFYAPGVESNPADHFSSKFRVYWHAQPQ